ncbi:MAG: primosomal protein N' [Hyphomicrobiales bacterium]
MMTDPVTHKPCDRVVEVLLPLALGKPYSYGVPSGLDLAEGDYVIAPLGSRRLVGVVWRDQGRKAAEYKGPALRMIVERMEARPMTQLHRDFIDWVARYNLVSAGAVLRMCLRVPKALRATPSRRGYRITDAPAPLRLTAQRKRVMGLMANGMVWPPGALAEAAAVTPGVIRGLVAAGVIEAVQRPAVELFAAPQWQNTVELSPEQERAARALCACVTACEFSTVLIDGVTGSGKTEVYLRAVAETLAQGRQALILLPEIALTAQFIERVETHFVAKPAEWHSGMKNSERERVWRAVADGEALIVVGARSALFLPYRKLGLIVVDEEHEPAFKQEDGVIYHARNMAVAYGALGQFPVILSSATPSLETLVNVDRARYGHLVLTARHGGAELPPVKTIDMRKERLERGSWMTDALVEAVGQTLEAGEQTLLFLNRRGYAPLTLCRNCGYRFHCPDCDAWLVEHRFRKVLLCHHCGRSQNIPEHCPECGAQDSMAACGPGVERLAEEVGRRFAQARRAILSSDNVHGKALHRLLGDIAGHRFDIIIGTQLVAKGHHFPALTLVGVVDADLALDSSDPRAAERTYQLLHQVAGRAGRAQYRGRALVQTHRPDHPLMRALEAGDPKAFLDREKAIRQAAGLPPYGRLAGIVISGGDRDETAQFARDLSRRIPQNPRFKVFGPAPAPLTMIRRRHRFRFLVQTGRHDHIQGFMRAWLGGVKPRGSLKITIDIDPQSFL